MLNIKENLDNRICDIDKEFTNEQTFREFFKRSEEEFKLEPADLDNMSEEVLASYLEFLDYLWTK